MSFICNSIFFIFYFLLLPWWFLFFSITFLHYSDISEKADLSMADLKYVLSSGVKKKNPNHGFLRRWPWFWVGSADNYLFYAHLLNWQLLPCCRRLRSKITLCSTIVLCFFQDFFGRYETLKTMEASKAIAVQSVCLFWSSLRRKTLQPTSYSWAYIIILILFYYKILI